MNKVNQQIRTLKLSNVQQEQYFQKILELLATGIITYDKKGFIHHANSAAKKLLSLDVLTHLQQLEKTDKKLYPLIRNLDPFERRLIALNTDKGEIQLSLKSTSFGTAENELTILSINDIKNELDEKEIDSWMSLIGTEPLHFRLDSVSLSSEYAAVIGIVEAITASIVAVANTAAIAIIFDVIFISPKLSEYAYLY